MLQPATLSLGFVEWTEPSKFKVFHIRLLDPKDLKNLSARLSTRNQSKSQCSEKKVTTVVELKATYSIDQCLQCSKAFLIGASEVYLSMLKNPCRVTCSLSLYILSLIHI